MVNGIINVYKEKGYTSHDVVAKLRGIIGQKKIGHTGTLDPDAEGVLPVCLGKATRLCDLLTEKEKPMRPYFSLAGPRTLRIPPGKPWLSRTRSILRKKRCAGRSFLFRGLIPRCRPCIRRSK